MRFNDYLIEGINDVGIFKAVFMCGSPGAGKSYTVSKLTSTGARVVNTDKMLEYFEFNKAVAAELDKVKTLTKNQLVLYLNSLLPLFIDSTSTNPNALVRRRGLLESLGYECGMIFVNTNLETALDRARNRARQVPEDMIKRKYEEAQNLLPFYKSKFDFYVEVDNNDGELDNEALQSASKQVTNFFTSPLDSPLGQKVVYNMKSNGWKYLTPEIHTMEYLKKVVDVWYKN